MGENAEIKHSDFSNLSMQYLLPTGSLCWWSALRRFLRPSLCQTPTRFRMTLLGASQRHSLPLSVFSSHANKKEPSLHAVFTCSLAVPKYYSPEVKWRLSKETWLLKERLWLSNFENSEIQSFLGKESSLASLLLITTKKGIGTQKGKHTPVCLSLEDITIVRLWQSEFQYRKWMVTRI